MARPVILVVDDDPGVRESFRLILEDHYDVVDVPDGPSALEVVRASPMDLVLLDIRLPGMDGILTLASRALERRTLEREVALLRSELARTHDLDEIVGKHPVMEKLHGLIAQVARTSTTVLITRESGTGKELVARAIHRHGPPAA